MAVFDVQGMDMAALPFADQVIYVSIDFSNETNGDRKPSEQ